MPQQHNRTHTYMQQNGVRAAHQYGNNHAQRPKLRHAGPPAMAHSSSTDDSSDDASTTNSPASASHSTAASTPSTPSTSSTPTAPNAPMFSGLREAKKPLSFQEAMVANQIPLIISLLSAAVYMLDDDKNSWTATAFKVASVFGLSRVAHNTRRLLQARSDDSQDDSEESVKAQQILATTSHGMLAHAAGAGLINKRDVLQSLLGFGTGHLTTAKTLFDNAKPRAEWTRAEKLAVGTTGAAWALFAGHMFSKSRIPHLAKVGVATYGAAAAGNLMLSMVQPKQRLPLAAGSILCLAADALAFMQMNARASVDPSLDNSIDGDPSVSFGLYYAGQLCLMAGLTRVALECQHNPEQGNDSRVEVVEDDDKDKSASAAGDGAAADGATSTSPRRSLSPTRRP